MLFRSKLSHYIHCTHDITHPIYDITHMAIRTLYLPSVPLYRTSTVSVSSKPGYQLYHTLSMYDITHYTCDIIFSNHDTQQLFRTLHTSMYNFTPSIFMTSYPICTLSPYHFHKNTTTIPDISPTIFDITATVSVSSHRWHTPQYRRIALLMTSQQVCKS